MEQVGIGVVGNWVLCLKATQGHERPQPRECGGGGGLDAGIQQVPAFYL